MVVQDFDAGGGIDRFHRGKLGSLVTRPLAAIRSQIQKYGFPSGADFVDDGAGDVGKPEVPALEAIGELHMVGWPTTVQDGRVQIMHVDFVLDHVEAQFVAFADGDAGLDAAARQPHGERVRMMIAAVIPALHHRRAAEFAAPDDQRVVEQAALLQICDQSGAGLIGVVAVLR